ncbi:MAG: carboxypeptidase-like regulatory domain-containing protein [Candidatus Acidiferrum sp.]
MNTGKSGIASRVAVRRRWSAVLGCRDMSSWGRLLGRGALLSLGLGMALVFGFPALAHPAQTVLAGEAEHSLTGSLAGGLVERLTVSAGSGAATGQQPAVPQAAGTINGSVVDRSGGAVAGAHVKLLSEDPSKSQEVVADSEGQFSLTGIAPGPFELAIMADGFATQTISGTVHVGENFTLPAIELAVASGAEEVKVAMSRTELAEAEIKDEEKQRVFGVVPNFYVTYDPSAFPLSRKQKFELAWKTTIDPVSFGLAGAVAGIEQATDAFNGYGQGAPGYAKRYGASYGDLVTGTFIGSAVLPSLLKQDPRYFYKGKGTVRSRVLYAIANAVICKGDNGKWEPNYSSILGGVASAGISNLYYPAANRDGLTLTAENTLIGIGTTAAANLLQEFVIRRLTPHAPSYTPVEP